MKNRPWKYVAKKNRFGTGGMVYRPRRWPALYKHAGGYAMREQWRRREDFMASHWRSWHNPNADILGALAKLDPVIVRIRID